MVKIKSKIVFFLLINCLSGIPFYSILSQNKYNKILDDEFHFYKIVDGKATAFLYDPNNFASDWTNIIAWEASQASSIPFKYENWTWPSKAATNCAFDIFTSI